MGEQARVREAAAVLRRIAHAELEAARAEPRAAKLLNLMELMHDLRCAIAGSLERSCCFPHWADTAADALAVIFLEQVHSRGHNDGEAAVDRFISRFQATVNSGVDIVPEVHPLNNSRHH